MEASQLMKLLQSKGLLKEETENEDQKKSSEETGGQMRSTKKVQKADSHAETYQKMRKINFSNDQQK